MYNLFMEKFRLWVERNPILAGGGLILLALALRLNDIFILRLDERLGEIILSKALGFVLVVAFAWGLGQAFEYIFLHRSRLADSVKLGLGLTLAAWLVAYLAEYGFALADGQAVALTLDAIDPKTGLSGGVWFGAWLVFGNVVNALMEEGLFRGALLRLLPQRMSWKQANWLQAFLFGLWHLPWVWKWQQTGQISSPDELPMAILSNFLPQFLMGAVWGWMVIRTGNLWTPVIAHFLTNTTLNLLHVAYPASLDDGIVIRFLVFVMLSLISIVPLKRITADWRERLDA